MIFPRPRSLSGLILLGLLLVSLPLLGGVVNAGLEMTRLSESSERLVAYGVQATRYSQALVRQVAVLERTARLYQLLGRPELKAVFDENLRRMTVVLDAVSALPGNETKNDVVAEIRRRTDRVASGLESTEAARRAEALREFGLLSTATGQLSLLASQQIDRELKTVQRDTEQARRRLLWQTSALVPVSLLIALAFALLVARPLRDIDRAIANLGHGKLNEPIEVRGPPTDLEALGRQIEWLRQRLLEVTEERERFLRHVSHELKTPLANIREGSELLLEGTVGQLKGEQQEIASILRDNSLRLQKLIENLLSYSEWRSSHAQLDLSEVQLAPLVQSVVESYRLQIGTRRLRLDIVVPDLELRADRAKLRLVIDNLLSNAIKFTPEDGTIRIEARADGQHVIITVSDSGPGIVAEERDRIFEPFFQGASRERGLVPGTGIGLSVVREFVEAHGGRIELVATDRPGAHFHVLLPLDPANPSAVA